MTRRVVAFITGLRAELSVALSEPDARDRVVRLCWQVFALLLACCGLFGYCGEPIPNSDQVGGLLIILGVLIVVVVRLLNGRDYWETMARLEQRRGDGWDVDEQIRAHRLREP